MAAGTPAAARGVGRTSALAHEPELRRQQRRYRVSKLSHELLMTTERDSYAIASECLTRGAEQVVCNDDVGGHEGAELALERHQVRALVRQMADQVRAVHDAHVLRMSALPLQRSGSPPSQLELSAFAGREHEEEHLVEGVFVEEVEQVKHEWAAREGEARLLRLSVTLSTGTP